jgi:hypothetical protein
LLIMLGILFAGLASPADAQVQRVVEFGAYDAAAAVTAGPSGTFLVAGSSATDIALSRMMLDGSLDSSNSAVTFGSPLAALPVIVRRGCALSAWDTLAVSLHASRCVGGRPRRLKDEHDGLAQGHEG